MCKFCAVEINTILFLALVATGAFIQTITGFAMGLITMAGVATLAIADISFSAAVVSFISLVNALVALRHGYRQVDWYYVRHIVIGLVPALIIGVVTLTWLSEHFYDFLRTLLGVTIVLAGSMLMISPNAFDEKSSPAMITLAGTLGGLLAGLYSAGGAPLAYFMYRQPLSINTIRFTLLMVFALSTAIRAVIVGVAGQLDMSIIKMSFAAIPLVVIVTLATTRLVPFIPDKMVRGIVFVVLTASGVFLVFSE
jgi:uncharacterized membrane protein YfcA